MDLDLEVLKELYIKEVEKLKELAFYQYLQKERKLDIAKEILRSIASSDDEDIFNEVKVYVEGGLLKGIREKYGDDIGEDITKLAGEIWTSERNKEKPLVEKERQKMKNTEYHCAIDYLCHILIIRKIKEKLLAKDVVPEIDMVGKIIFKTKR